MAEGLKYGTVTSLRSETSRSGHSEPAARGPSLKYGTPVMLGLYFEWKRLNRGASDIPPWPYYDDDPDYQDFEGYPSWDDLEDVKAWLADMETRLYGRMERS